MSERSEKKKSAAEEADEIKQILGAVSTEVPGLIKSIIASVFSEEAGKSMGKAAAAFYRELKDSGMPDEVAVKMTEDYISVFTSLGDIMRRAGGGGKLHLAVPKGKCTAIKGMTIEQSPDSPESAKEATKRVSEDELEREIERRVRQRLAERRREEDEEDED